MERHTGPLHLQAEDVGRVVHDPNNDPETVEQQVEPIDGFESNNEDEANVQNDSENNMDCDQNDELIGNSELNGEDERKVNEKLDGQNDAIQNTSRTGSNSHASDSAERVDDENVATGKVVPFNQYNS